MSKLKSDEEFERSLAGLAPWGQKAQREFREKMKAEEAYRKKHGIPEPMGFFHTLISAILAIAWFLFMAWLFVEVLGFGYGGSW